jgi:threonine aldolase
LPYAVGARDGLRRRLPKMAAYAARAEELAAGLDSLDGVRVHPNPPHTNAFRVFVDLAGELLDEAGLRMMETDQVALVSWWRPAEVPGWAMTELHVGDATLARDVEAQLAAIRDMINAARQLARPSTPGVE